jgi:hypothetical protein
MVVMMGHTTVLGRRRETCVLPSENMKTARRELVNWVPAILQISEREY